MRKDPLRESHDDEGDVVYISSQGSRTDQTDPEAEDDSETEGDDNGNMIINPVQLHLSYEDSQDVEIYQIQDNRVSPHFGKKSKICSQVLGNVQK